jgi:replicative DNA helicase
MPMMPKAYRDARVQQPKSEAETGTDLGVGSMIPVLPPPMPDIPLPITPVSLPETAAPAGFGPDGSDRRFPFGNLFQTKALAIILRLPSVMQDYVTDIRPGYFSEPTHQTLFRLIQQYYTLYKMAPTEVAMKELVREDARRLGHGDDFVAAMATLIDEVLKVDISEAEWLQDKITNFVKFRRALEVTMKMADVVEQLDKSGEGDFAKIVPMVRELNAIGARGGLGFSFNDNYDKLPDILTNSSDYSSATKVPLGFSKVDHALDGGVGAGHVVFFVAGSGVGKSSVLAQTAAVDALAGFNVCVYTCELKEEDYSLRIMQRLGGLCKEHVIYDSVRYQQRLPIIKEAMENAGRIHVKYFPPGRASVDKLRSHFSQLITRVDNGRPWVVLLDYVEKLKLGGDDRRGNRDDWALIGDTVDDLIAFGHEFGTPVISASQTNRQGYAKVARGKGRSHTDKDDIGSSWKKIEHADVVLAFDQSEMEKAAGIARIRALKVRRGKDGFTFRVRDDRPIMNFVELDNEGREVLQYSPRRDGEMLNLYISRWVQDDLLLGESRDGLIRPPQVDIENYRTEQIQQLLAEQRGIDVDDLVAMQGDGANGITALFNKLSNIDGDRSPVPSLISSLEGAEGPQGRV